VTIGYNESLVRDENKLKLLHYENGFWKDVTRSVDTINNTITGIVSSLSPFVTVETVTPTDTPCTSCGAGGGPSGGGGGGGGGSSMEDFSNILFTEKVDFNLIKDKPVTQIFKSNDLVYELDVVGANNEDFVTFKVELLKGITRTANTTPEGTVYRYMNIYSGTKRLKEASIRFKVNNSWMTDSYDIKLLRLVDGEWAPLETTRINKDDTYTYFEAKTTGFLSFAIVGKTPQTSVQAEETAKTLETPQKIEQMQAQSQDKESPGFGAIFTAIGFLVLYVLLRKGK